MFKQAITVTAMLLAATGAALADPTEIGTRGDNGDSPLQLLAAPTQPCAVKGGICLTAGSHTMAVSSAEVAVATGGGKAPPIVPRFARAEAVASADGSGGSASSSGANAPWTVELTGTLKRPAWNGNALFLFFDLEDPNSIDNREYTALYQAPLKAGKNLTAQVALSPDEGFRAGHTYRLRVVQLINNKEMLLTEADLALQ
ncbi:MAG TPA: hypothetical protein VIA18_16645 [Polyangia bacterium]|jgi:phage terminase large subunit-like protein|nr:hypothetical protein [Polyangia bacterium]